MPSSLMASHDDLHVFEPTSHVCARGSFAAGAEHESGRPQQRPAGDPQPPMLLRTREHFRFPPQVPGPVHALPPLKSHAPVRSTDAPN